MKISFIIYAASLLLSAATALPAQIQIKAETPLILPNSRRTTRETRKSASFSPTFKATS